MPLPWYWIALGAASLLVAYQQFAIYQIHQKSKQREELFRIVTENAADMIALVDVKGRRIYNSPAYKRVLGYSSAELGETSSFDQIHPDDRFKVLEAARDARSTGFGRRLEYRIRHKDGSWRTLESLASPIRDGNGQVVKLVIVNRDITDRKRAEELLEQASFYDSLTKLPNRRLFLDRLQHLFERAIRNPEQQFAVLFADLDGFKTLHDTLGAAFTDRILFEISQRLDACLRDQDTVSRPQNKLPLKNAVLSRLGGDEFTILLEAIHDPSDAMRVAHRILAAVSQPSSIAGQKVRTSISIGIASSITPHEQAEDLLQEAEVGMRRAKALGGSRCEMFDEAMHTRAVNQLKLEDELHEALNKRQFRILYQPVVKLNNRQITGFEALLRWQHPEQGLISPYKFGVTAENTGLLRRAGQWLILEACRQRQRWANEIPGAEGITISANISAKQLADAYFVKEIEKSIAETGVDPAHLSLEITEDIAAADPKLTATVLSQLKQMHVGVSLDDFGTGNSSLIGLRQLPVESLKIDRSLISGMLLDRSANDAVEMILLLAKKLKLKAIAEGIESAKQLDHLNTLACEFGQGYLFSPPVDAKNAETLLRRQNTALLARGSRTSE